MGKSAANAAQLAVNMPASTNAFRNILYTTRSSPKFSFCMTLRALDSGEFLHIIFFVVSM